MLPVPVARVVVAFFVVAFFAVAFFAVAFLAVAFFAGAFFAPFAALAGPFANVRFCPTGGVTPDNAPDYLALPNVACVGGSWLVPDEAVRAGDWRAIESLARTAVEGLRRRV